MQASDRMGGGEGVRGRVWEACLSLGLGVQNSEGLSRLCTVQYERSK